MKYVYGVNLEKMEESYWENTSTNFFANKEERDRFNAELIINADSEEESLRIRMGMTDIRMWDLLRTEP